MIDDVWNREEIDSPCIKLCVLHSEAKICVGCHRSAEEIQMWSKYTPEQRLLIISELPSRKSIIIKRRGGRNRHVKNQING